MVTGSNDPGHTARSWPEATAFRDQLGVPEGRLAVKALSPALDPGGHGGSGLRARALHDDHAPGTSHRRDRAGRDPPDRGVGHGVAGRGTRRRTARPGRPSVPPPRTPRRLRSRASGVLGDQGRSGGRTRPRHDTRARDHVSSPTAPSRRTGRGQRAAPRPTVENSARERTVVVGCRPRGVAIRRSPAVPLMMRVTPAPRSRLLQRSRTRPTSIRATRFGQLRAAERRSRPAGALAALPACTMVFSSRSTRRFWQAERKPTADLPSTSPRAAAEVDPAQPGSRRSSPRRLEMPARRVCRPPRA